MAISYNDPFHFRADELMMRRPRNLDQKPEPGALPPAQNPGDPFGVPRPLFPTYRDDSPKLPVPALPPPQMPPVLPPGNPFPDPSPWPRLQLPPENRVPPPIYVDPPGDNFENDLGRGFVVTENRSMRAVEPPAGGLLGLLQTMTQQPNAEPYTGSAFPPNGASATPPEPPLPPQEQDEADQAQQAREAAAAQLVRGVRRLARINTEPPDADGLVDGFARAYANGVPIIGAYNNKIEAGLEASLAPILNPLADPEDQLSEPTWKERYETALGRQDAIDARFAAQHPQAARLADFAGNLSTIRGLGKTPLGTRMFGLTEGPLREAMLRGATTRAAISGADAAARGEPPGEKFALSTALGAARPVTARVLEILPFIRNLARLP